MKKSIIIGLLLSSQSLFAADIVGSYHCDAHFFGKHNPWVGTFVVEKGNSGFTWFYHGDDSSRKSSGTLQATNEKNIFAQTWTVGEGSTEDMGLTRLHFKKNGDIHFKFSVIEGKSGKMTHGDGKCTAMKKS